MYVQHVVPGVCPSGGGKLEPNARVLMRCFSVLAVMRLQVSTGKGFSKTLSFDFQLLGAIPCKFPRYPKGEMRAVPLWDVNPVW